ncbi:MAG: glycoside hydrolase family 31 protein [Sphingobacteriales bacterium]|nr:glycoside hydrolase family 31 protein [Sphingobacteriales bacterium]
MKCFFAFFLLFYCALPGTAQPGPHSTRANNSFILTGPQGNRLRITAYGDYMIRVQAVRNKEEFFPDDHYEMVASHNWPGKLVQSKTKGWSGFTTGVKGGIAVRINNEGMIASFYRNGASIPFLKERNSTQWEGDSIRTSFISDTSEHFTGLGHGYFGRVENIDLRGQRISRNYGTEHRQQAPLIVPFYLSDKGYGIFLNSTFPNTFDFGNNAGYAFSIQGDGRMDYFVILGPSFTRILDRYTQLTGRPRLPLKAFFGLALSDKGNDHNSPDPSDEQWWKKKITEHRAAGFPLDHIVNDNRWRAGGGQRCLSYFDWDKTRYPDPGEYQQWVKKNGLITTLDFNRCIAVQSEGWKPSFNLPQNEGIDFNTSAPDFTKKEVRDWFWNTMWSKSLNPALRYPGDALWIDEFDEMGKAPVTMKFGNGTTWLEMRNYWFFLVAKSLVQQGWDKSFNGTKRPFVWVRGMTAGAQRYATLWSGDINSTYEDMKTQVRGLQLAGLSGFPFWGHDAGGFHLGDSKTTPGDSMYSQWSMAWGSFTPFWKPHGVGKSRWPLDRPEAVRKDARLYSELRYKLMPYIYTYARRASETGIPLARAMVIDYQKDPLAWKSDLQYMWGNELLVAPNCSDSDHVALWLPKGKWYDFWDDHSINGDRVINYPAPVGKLPLFVKAGSILPMANYALSTAFIHEDTLTLHVYPGKDAAFTLYEDDGITENYRNRNEKRTTAITFNHASFSLKIGASAGAYIHSPQQRAYTIVFHGMSRPLCFEVNGTSIKKLALSWDAEKKTQTLSIQRFPVTKNIVIKTCRQ